MFCYNFEKTASKVSTVKNWLKARGRSIPKKIENMPNHASLKGRSEGHYAALKAGMAKKKQKHIGRRMAGRSGMSEREIDFILGVPAAKRTQ